MLTIDDCTTSEDEEEVVEDPGAAEAAAATVAAAAEAASKRAATLEECCALLRGPTDERRLVGLLLVTRLLPSGDDAALSAVFSTCGPAFLARLLQPTPAATSVADKGAAEAGCGLAATVCAALCRCAQVAASDAWLGEGEPPVLSPFASRLLRVAEAGGSEAEEALEALAAVAQAQPAACSALRGEGAQRIAAAALARPPSASAHAGSAALLAALLEAEAGGGGGSEPPPAEEEAEAALLAAGLPALCAALSASPQSPSERAASASAHALRALVALLTSPRRLPHLLSAAAAHDPHPAWRAQLAVGLGGALRQKHASAASRAALLSALPGAARLLGEGWARWGGDGTLLTPAVEVAAVETTVLLHELARRGGEGEGGRGGEQDCVSALGACLACFEATVGALAYEEEAEEEEEGGAAHAKPAHAPPPLPPQASLSALRTLGRMADVMFDFLDEARGGENLDLQQDTAPSPPPLSACAPPSFWRTPQATAVVRALGCFLAEVPGALRPRLLSLLPELCRASDAALSAAAGTGGEAPPQPPLLFLLPALLQASDGEAGAEEGEEEEEAAQAMGVALLDAGGVGTLCGLISATVAAKGEAAAVAAALGVLRNLCETVDTLGGRAEDDAAQKAAARGREALCLEAVRECVGEACRWGARQGGSGEAAEVAEAVEGVTELLATLSAVTP